MVKILNSERVAIIGATGTGKTQLCKFFLSRLNRVIVIDPKHTFKLDGFKQGWKIPFMATEFKIIVRPGFEDDEKLMKLIRKLFREGDVTIYCDEMPTLADGYPLATKALAEVARTGREKHVALWSAMQRPRGTPKVFLTEAEVFFVFNLRSLEDRLYIKGFAGDQIVKRVPKYTFWYIRADEDYPALLTLNLSKGRIEIPKEERSPSWENLEER